MAYRHAKFQYRTTLSCQVISFPIWYSSRENLVGGGGGGVYNREYKKRENWPPYGPLTSTSLV